MKAILISINPRYVKDILSGIKTIEIRKSMPKCDLPIDVYIYCTQKNYLGYLSNRYAGKVVAKFRLNKIDQFYDFEDELCDSACLTREEMIGYLGDKIGCAWHIENLEIFDRPRTLQPYFDMNRPPQSWCYFEV